MPAQILQIASIVSDASILLIVLYYFFVLRAKEKKLNQRERKVDTEYHQVVDTALSRERKIVDDAVKEANEIIVDTQFVSGNAKQTLDKSLEKLVFEIQKDALNTAQTFSQSYHNTLQQLANQSLQGFHTVSEGMQAELQKTTKQFQETLLPTMEKEVEEYKQARMRDAERMVTQVVNTVAQETLNKTIPLADHKNLIIESLEKAKKEGLFGENS